MRGVALIALALMLVTSAHAETVSVSIWRWKKITLRLEAEAERRTFLFEKMPPDYAKSEGIQPGATFWDGTRQDDQLVGEAYLYGAGCEPVTFAMSGSAKLNAKGEITLHATPPERKPGSCETIQVDTFAAVPFVFKLISKRGTFKDDE